MNIVTLLPFIVLIGAMVLMTRSAKKKQQQAAAMRDQMQPGTGIRTIGGMYATVKEVGDDTVLLEVAPGVHAVYAKNAVAAVLEDAEYNRIVHGAEFDGGESEAGTPVVPDDASSLTAADRPAAGDEPAVDLGKDGAAEDTKAAEAAEVNKKDDGDTDAK
ncbi:preprotein translocase subunit YajC [Streptomyces albus]|uniref:preprotein translocase subunit YajC n=1 Tax=Streptomyces albus TaxID=1888 RepID=UPI0004C53685|nr:preprotein translocase subunit YajC [Streptomyces albus]